jgi:hypothetical protein
MQGGGKKPGAPTRARSSSQAPASKTVKGRVTPGRTPAPPAKPRPPGAATTRQAAPPSATQKKPGAWSARRVAPAEEPSASCAQPVGGLPSLTRRGVSQCPCAPSGPWSPSASSVPRPTGAATTPVRGQGTRQLAGGGALNDARTASDVDLDTIGQSEFVSVDGMCVGLLCVRVSYACARTAPFGQTSQSQGRGKGRGLRAPLASQFPWDVDAV